LTERAEDTASPYASPDPSGETEGAAGRPSLIPCFYVGLFLLSALGYWTYAQTQRSVLADVRLSPEITAEIFEEYDWDPGRGIYVEAFESGRTIVPVTFLFADHQDESYEFLAVSANEGQLLGVAVREEGSFRLEFLYDCESKESWPRLRMDEVSYAPEVKAKWGPRFRAVATKHPGLELPY